MSSFDLTLCPFIERGIPNGPPLLFLAGFPDTELSCWGDAVPELSTKFRCVFTCLPGYSSTPSQSSDVAWGFEQEEVITLLHNTISTVGLKNEKFVFMAHDWGAYYALLYTTRYPNAVSKLILCDIGMCTAFSLPLTSIPFIAFYQLTFAVAYFVSQAINVRLGEWLFLNVGIKAFFAILSPNKSHRANVDSALTVRKCYPYYYLWRRLLTGTTLPQSFPTCPLLFMVS